MVKSDRNIYINFHNSKDKNDVVGRTIANNGEKAETMTLNDYNRLKKGDKNYTSKKDFKFNEKTGTSDKTKEWNNTVIVIDEAQVKTSGAVQAAQMGTDDLQKGVDVQLVDVGTHEGTHTIQNSADFCEATKDPQTGNYIESEDKPYDNRDVENTAINAGKQARDELKKKYTNNQQNP